MEGWAWESAVSTWACNSAGSAPPALPGVPLEVLDRSGWSEGPGGRAGMARAIGRTLRGSEPRLGHLSVLTGSVPSEGAKQWALPVRQK